VMRCANYRLVCPNGLLLSHGQVCERCISGREHWCVLRNCEGSLPKSLGYALRNFVARTRRLYRDNVTLYYAQTDFQKKKLMAGGFPASRIEVIPNMVDTSTPPRETQVGHYVGFAGRGSPEKGVAILLQAARTCSDLPFRLAGDFWRMPEVAKVKPDNVELLGHLIGPRLEEFFRDCRLLVLPSTWYEGFPGVAIEAMLHGKTLEALTADRVSRLPALREALSPLRVQLSRSPYLGGSTPNYADYIALGAFHWVASVSTLPALAANDDVIRAWLDRGFDLYEGLGRDPRMKSLFE